MSEEVKNTEGQEPQKTARRNFIVGMAKTGGLIAAAGGVVGYGKGLYESSEYMRKRREQQARRIVDSKLAGNESATPDNIIDKYVSTHNNQVRFEPAMDLVRQKVAKGELDPKDTEAVIEAYNIALESVSGERNWRFIGPVVKNTAAGAGVAVGSAVALAGAAVGIGKGVDYVEKIRDQRASSTEPKTPG